MDKRCQAVIRRRESMKDRKNNGQKIPRGNKGTHAIWVGSKTLSAHTLFYAIYKIIFYCIRKIMFIVIAIISLRTWKWMTLSASFGVNVVPSECLSPVRKWFVPDMVDLVIIVCLTSRRKHFMHINEENKFNNIKITTQKWRRNGKTRATTFDCHLKCIESCIGANKCYLL